MFDFIYSWVDALWLPIMYYGVHKQHRWYALGFVLSSMILIRLLAETIIYSGYDTGIMGLLNSNVYTRGIVVSCFFYIIFLIMSYYSQNTKGVVFMAACLSFFFMIFVSAAIAMVL